MTSYVIIGGSAAGISCCEAIRDVDEKGPITLISDEKASLYSRCLLTYLIGGKIDKERLLFKDKDFYKTKNIEALHGVKAVSIDIKKKEIDLDNKKSVKFDKLLIATGASSKRLNIPGGDKKGVFGLRDIIDAEGIMSMLDNVDTAVILGGGLIGLRDAYALKLRGKKVKVIVKSPQVLSQIVDKDAAFIIEKKLAQEGIEVMKGLAATRIDGNDSVTGVTLDDKSKLSCQMVIIGKGVQPNRGLADGTGIKVEDGIIVDNRLQTSVKDIYAAGDVAQAPDITTGGLKINAVWPVAIEQGKIAGLNMAGRDTVYDGSNMMNSTDFFGLAVISIGITKPKESVYEELKYSDRETNTYKKVVLRDNIICGAVLVNKVVNAGVYGVLIAKKVDCTPIKDILLSDNFDYAKILPIVKGFPDKFNKPEFKETVMSI
ncbi:MAG: NAD(P)/FAD-dependent oxidoreductase [Candidatus Omnitrophica bacterium]|nr:NAD(P)/FAD-dependent oxidoreductase [Candidatus Omnitrophota bacterium]